VQTGTTTSSYLTNQPDTIANLQVYYEQGPIAVRVAFNSVSEFQDAVNTTGGVITPQLFGARETVDASVQYRLSDRYRLFFDVKNVTDEPSRFRYIGDTAFVRDRRSETPRLWIVGVRGNF
jgi:outer membrane receptor protein involved in Fe transport